MQSKTIASTLALAAAACYIGRMWTHTLDPGLRVIALPSPTLPPATTTNAVLIGEDEPWLVDPAPPRAADRERLVQALAERGGVAGILLTHHHRDHVGAAAWLSDALGVPVAAHRDTAALALGAAPRLAANLEVSVHLDEGSRVAGDWSVLHTPGHASDHLCFFHEKTGALVVGDMVASVGTIVVDPPDGHMGTYLAQLERLRALNASVAVPAHGAPITAPSDLFGAYLAHRSGREALVRAALTPAPRSLDDITARSYPELPRGLLPLARRACLAHLEALHERGEAAWEGPEGPAGGARPWLAPGVRWAANP